MQFKTLVLAVLTVLALSLMSGVPGLAQAESATLVVINYVGAELIFTLDGTVHSVPGTDVQPTGGQLQLALAAGRHEYSGAIPGGPGANGQVELLPGQTYVLGARLERSAAVLSPEGVVLEKPTDRLVWFEASLAPAAETPVPTRQALQPIPAGQGALVLDNYIGEELVINLDGALYRVPANGRLQLNLAPGAYTYSASVAASSINGGVEVVAGEYLGLGFSRQLPPTPEYAVGKPEPTPVTLQLHVTVVPLAPGS